MPGYRNDLKERDSYSKKGEENQQKIKGVPREENQSNEKEYRKT